VDSQTTQEMEQQTAIDYSTTFGRDDISARVLYDILSEAGIFTSSFDPINSIMAFNEGKRSLGLMIMDKMNMSPEDLSKYIDLAAGNEEPDFPKPITESENDHQE